MNKPITKGLLLKLAKLSWFNVYSTIITFIHLIFGMYENYFTLIINIFFFLNQYFTFSLIITIISKGIYQSEDFTLKYYSIRNLVFGICFIADLSILLLFHYVSFISYDKFEVFFTQFLLVTSVIRIGTVLYTGVVIKDIETDKNQ